MIFWACIDDLIVVVVLIVVLDDDSIDFHCYFKASRCGQTFISFDCDSYGEGVYTDHVNNDVIKTVCLSLTIRPSRPSEAFKTSSKCLQSVFRVKWSLTDPKTDDNIHTKRCPISPPPFTYWYWVEQSSFTQSFRLTALDPYGDQNTESPVTDLIPV